MIESRQRLAALHQRVPCPTLFALFYESGSVALHGLPHAIRFVPDDAEDIFRRDDLRRSHDDVAQQRTPADLVDHFWEFALESRTLAGGKNRYCEALFICGWHRPLLYPAISAVPASPRPAGRPSQPSHCAA